MLEVSTSTDSRRPFLAIVVCSACVASAAGQVPPTWHVSRDPEEWPRQLAHEESLGNLMERFPDEWPVLIYRWNLHARRKSMDVEAADALISELYVDHGHGRLNEANQDYLVGVIQRHIAKWPEEQLPHEARRHLRDGLLDFMKAGGGRASPGGQTRLALALDRLSSGEPEITFVVEELLNDAVEWVATNGSQPVSQRAVYDRAAQYWGEAYWFRAYERFHASALPEKRPVRYEKALEALVGVLSQESPDEQSFLGNLRNATNAVLRGCGEAVFDDDLTSRLLILYRGLLRRRPAIAEKAAEYIDGQLQRLSRGTERLRSKMHWDQWGQAVAALGLRRMSDGLEQFARRIQEATAAGKLDGPRSKAAGHLEFLRN